MLVMVIFLLYAIKMMNFSGELNLELPTLSSGSSQNTQNGLEIQLTSTGELFIKERKITWNELTSQLNPESAIILSTDKKTPFEYVFKLYEIFKVHGVKNINLKGLIK